MCSVKFEGGLTVQDPNLDLRIIRTRESIQKALFELIEEKGFEAITVKDITTRAKINRGTFYAHYQDKFDLMTKCEEEIMHTMSLIAKKNLPTVLSALESNLPMEAQMALVVSLFEFFNEYSGVFKALLGSNRDVSFQTRFKNFIVETFFGGNGKSIINEEKLLVPGHYLIA
jgi:AcrR family transcriptional regulator